jgi:NAD-dependent DNA ligase
METAMSQTATVRDHFQLLQWLEQIGLTVRELEELASSLMLLKEIRRRLACNKPKCRCHIDLGREQLGEYYYTHCPLPENHENDDARPSLCLSVRTSKKCPRLYVRCMADCSQSVVVNKLGDIGIVIEKSMSTFTIEHVAEYYDLSPDILKSYDVYEEEGKVIAPFKDRNGETVAKLVFSLGTWNVFGKGSKLTLYGIWKLSHQETVYLTCGVIDCWTVASYGFSAVALPKKIVICRTPDMVPISLPGATIQEFSKPLNELHREGSLKL